MATTAKKINPKKIADLKGANYNPRYITTKQLDALKKSIEQFGDLSGVVFNVSSGVLVSGHQRIKSISGKKTQIVKTAVKKDAQGTVAIGHIHVTEEGGVVTKIPYREVQWDNKLQEMAANVAANAAGGEFDQAKLGSIMAKLEKGKFDIELTSIDNWTMAKAIGKHKKSGGDGDEDAKGSNQSAAGEDDEDFAVIDPKAMSFTHSCPKCSYQWNGDSASNGKTAAKAKAMAPVPAPNPKSKVVKGTHAPKIVSSVKKPVAKVAAAVTKKQR